MTTALALLGGVPVRQKPFPRHPTIGDAEKKAVMEVLESGNISTFIASAGEYFLGGKRIKEFERRFAEYHRVQFAVAFNSATAALHAAVAAVGVKPCEEVITTPYTFTSSATCALMHNAIPVFADITDDIYGLDPAAVEKTMSPLTRAMIPVHLFGHPADMDELMAVARKHHLKVIEDCAQAPGGVYKNRLVGTIGDCGIFSFTESKNIMCGEGGMLITNDESIAEAARMVRNHGEVILASQKVRTYIPNLLGWNYRMTELEAALGIVQFGRMEELNGIRIELCDHLTRGLKDIPGFTTPIVKPDCKHVYYLYPLRYDESRTGIPRNLFAQALQAEGIPCGVGYVAPLYLSPLYHDKKPFAFQHYQGNARYDKGLCPVTERLHEKEILLIAVARAPAIKADMDDILVAIHKILDEKEVLLQSRKQ